MIITLHIAAGILSLASGAIALSTRKGSANHRVAGRVFVIAMLFMSGSGALVAAFTPKWLSVIGGVTTFYLVATAYRTLLPVHTKAMWIDRLLTIVAFITGVFSAAFGGAIVFADAGSSESFPSPPFFVFAALALCAAILDVRWLRWQNPPAKHRSARHLWRMCFAMFLACASFFLGQSQVFPAKMQHIAILSAPVLLVLVLLVYWLVRTLYFKRHSNHRAPMSEHASN